MGDFGAEAPALLRLGADVPEPKTTTPCEPSLLVLTSALPPTRIPSPSSSIASPIPNTSVSNAPAPGAVQTPPLLAHTTIAAITVGATAGICFIALLLWFWLRRLQARHEAAARDRAAREKLLAVNGGIRRGQSRGTKRKVRWDDDVESGDDSGRGRNGRSVNAVRRRRRRRERGIGGAGVADGGGTVNERRLESNRRDSTKKKGAVVNSDRSREDGSVKSVYPTRHVSGDRWQRRDFAAAPARERRARRRGGKEQRGTLATGTKQHRSSAYGGTEKNDNVHPRYAPATVLFSDKWTRNRRQRTAKNTRMKDEKQKSEKKAQVFSSNPYDFDDGVDKYGQPGGADFGDRREDSTPELGPDDSASLHGYRMKMRAEAEAEAGSDDHDDDTRDSGSDVQERPDGYIPYEAELWTKRRIRKLKEFIDWAEGGDEGRAETRRREESLERRQDEIDERAW